MKVDYPRSIQISTAQFAFTGGNNRPDLRDLAKLRAGYGNSFL
jgi:hypothetical protein